MFDPLWQSEDDKFANNSEEDAEAVDISLSTVCFGERPICNLRFADGIDLLGGSEEEMQQLTEKLEKTAAVAWKSADKRQKCSSTSVSSTRFAIHQHLDEYKSVGRSGPVQLLTVHRN